jgi:hypothetical protein
MGTRKKRDPLSVEGRLAAFNADLRMVNKLLRVTYRRAVAQDDSAAFGHLFEKLAARKSAMLGLDSPTKTDVHVLAEVKKPTTSEALHRAIEHMVKQGQLSQETQERIRPYGFLPEPDSKIIPSADVPSDLETEGVPRHHIDELSD